MSRNEIISNLFTGKNFCDCIKKMEPDYLRDDLKQEVILIICELPEGKLIKMHNEKLLEFFTVRVILNQIKSNTSPFAKKFRKIFAPIDGKDFNIESVDIADRHAKEIVEDSAIDGINELYWYNQEILKIYIQEGNFRAIENITGIPWISAYKNIKKSFSELKQIAVKKRNECNQDK